MLPAWCRSVAQQDANGVASVDKAVTWRCAAMAGRSLRWPDSVSSSSSVAVCRGRLFVVYYWKKETCREADWTALAPVASTDQCPINAAWEPVRLVYTKVYRIEGRLHGICIIWCYSLCMYRLNPEGKQREIQGLIVPQVADRKVEFGDLQFVEIISDLGKSISILVMHLLCICLN